MSSNTGHITEVQMKHVLDEVGIENNIRAEIVTLLKGKHRKKDIIEEKVFENIRNDGILNQVCERILSQKDSQALDDIQAVPSPSDEVHYTTSFTDSLSTGGGGDEKSHSHNSEKPNSKIMYKNSKLGDEKKDLLQSPLPLQPVSQIKHNYDNLQQNETSQTLQKGSNAFLMERSEDISLIIENCTESAKGSSKLSRQNSKRIEHRYKEDKDRGDIHVKSIASSHKMEAINRSNKIHIKPSDERVLSSLGLTDSKLTLADEGNDSLSVKLNPKKRHMHFEILSGKSFLDHLLEETFSLFLICLHFQGQRFWTQPTSCNSQPTFNAGFIFELHIKELGVNRIAEASHLLNISDPIHLVLLRVLPSGERFLVSSHFFEWRVILSSEESQKTLFIEMKGVGAESNVTMGILKIRLSLIPKLKTKLSPEDVRSKIESEEKIKTEKSRIFLLYGKKWWKEYLSIRPGHAHRTVKMFQQDENSVVRPVFDFIHILKVGRPILEMPREAAWFASLFLYKPYNSLGSLPAAEQWWDPFTYLCLKKGDSEDHANFLCSLLLGFGLDAYVCIGTKEGNVPWAWVVTCGKNNRTVFWESTTGVHYEHSSQTTNVLYHYKTVGCVFNNKSFYANIQETDKVQVCDFNLLNRRLWKSMSEAAISSVIRSHNLPLMPGWTDPFIHSQDMETELRHLIMEYRNDINLPTRWDIELCHLIAPFLTVYEEEHKMGVEIVIQELDDMLSKHIPDGFALKALPIRVTAMNNRRILGFCLQNSIMKSILTCPEPDTKLALKVHTYVYPENILSIWLIIACKYYMG